MLYYDCTSMEGASDPKVGIARVVFRLYEESKSWPNIVPVVFDPVTNCFRIMHISRAVKAGYPVQFSAGDRLVSAGCNWDFPTYNSVMRELKSKIDLTFTQLFHDIIPCLFPYFIPASGAKVYKKWFLDTYALMDTGFTISNSSKKDIQEYASRHQLQPKPITVVRLGDTTLEGQEAGLSHPDNFVLCVGTFEFRKNQTILLNTWKKLAQNRTDLPNLVLVGKTGWMDGNIESQCVNDPVLQKSTSIYKGIDDRHLAKLYRDCLFTLYPSRYEGWGLPIVESLVFGKVCIASNTSSMTEIAPGLVLHARPLHIRDWIQQIESLLDNPMYRKELEQKIKGKYRKAVWRDTASLVFRCPAI